MLQQPDIDRYSHVFEPLQIGPVTIANRIDMLPQGVALSAPTPGHEWYRNASG
jgi:2,4-dienoyl-CoA reductase-like NADH-dependent reductase (Old Yellow Enzyme family)